MPTTDEEQGTMNIDRIIQSAILNAYVFSKARFDSSKDTQDLLTAASESQKALQLVIEYSLRDRLDQLVVERIDEMLGDSDKCIVRIAGKLYQIEPLEETA